MAEIEIKGRKIPLLYTTFEMKTIQEEIAPIGEVFPRIVGRNPNDPDDLSGYAGPEHLETIGKMIMILGNAGLEEAGEKPDLTLKKVMRGLNPKQIVEAVNACLDALNEGMHSEIPDKKEEGPVDVTLEEMQKKSEAEKSPT